MMIVVSVIVEYRRCLTSDRYILTFPRYSRDLATLWLLFTFLRKTLGLLDFLATVCRKLYEEKTWKDSYYWQGCQ